MNQMTQFSRVNFSKILLKNLKPANEIFEIILYIHIFPDSICVDKYCRGTTFGDDYGGEDSHYLHRLSRWDLDVKGVQWGLRSWSFQPG